MTELASSFSAGGLLYFDIADFGPCEFRDLDRLVYA